MPEDIAAHKLPPSVGNQVLRCIAHSADEVISFPQVISMEVPEVEVGMLHRHNMIPALPPDILIMRI